MISDNLKPTYQLNRQDAYVFLKRCIDEDGDTCYHLFIFDDVGGCYDSRLFLPESEKRKFEECLKYPNGQTRPYWELVPNGRKAFPDARYEPTHKTVILKPEHAAALICYDKLYSFECLNVELHSMLKTDDKRYPSEVIPVADEECSLDGQTVEEA